MIHIRFAKLKYFLLSIMLSTFINSTYGQKSFKHEFGFQISTPIKHQGSYKYFNDDWLINPTGNQPDPDKRRNFKYGLNLFYFYPINGNIKIGIKGGIGKRFIHEYYKFYQEGVNPWSGVYEVSEYTQEIKYNQLNWHIEPVISFYERFRNFEFIVGIGPSYKRIGIGKQDYDEFTSYQEQSSWSLDVKNKTKIGGGNCFGINAFSSINYCFKNKFSIGFQVDSYMHYIICKEKTTFTWTKNSNNYPNAPCGETKGSGEKENDFQQFSFADLVPGFNLIYKF